MDNMLLLPRIFRIFRRVLVAYFCWLGMMAVHESGHVLCAWLSGGHVQRVVFPLWGFSRTDVWPDPSPQFETWGGPVMGCVWPLLACALLKLVNGKVWLTMLFFTGFCLIVNGSYLGVGWAMHSGDASDLVEFGTPKIALIAFGFVTVLPGLFIWHRLGRVAQLLQ
jgi:hypothetical protein